MKPDVFQHSIVIPFLYSLQRRIHYIPTNDPPLSTEVQLSALTKRNLAGEVNSPICFFFPDMCLPICPSACHGSLFPTNQTPSSTHTHNPERTRPLGLIDSVQLSLQWRTSFREFNRSLVLSIIFIHYSVFRMKLIIVNLYSIIWSKGGISEIW